MDRVNEMERMAAKPRPLAVLRKEPAPVKPPVVQGEATLAGQLAGASAVDDATAALIRRATGKDSVDAREAFTELMSRYYDSVMRQIMLYVGADHAAAEDVAQETWWRIARALGGFSGRSGFYTWACRIGRNEAIRRGRKLRALPVLPEPRQDAQHQAAETGEVVRLALLKLPEKFRQPLLLELWEEMPLREIAKALNLPEGTVKSRLFRAREKFREIWQGMAENE